MAQDEAALATTYRELYRAKFRADVQAGTTQPFLVPLYFLGVWVVPTLYLAIPHRSRPWLYRARWAVLAFVVAFHLYQVRYAKSHNFASAYGVGLLAAWATIWNFTLLVWTRPQWEARRVEVRRRKGRGQSVDNAHEGSATTSSSSPESASNGRVRDHDHPQEPTPSPAATGAEVNERAPDDHLRDRKSRREDASGHHQEKLKNSKEKENEEEQEEQRALAAIKAFKSQCGTENAHHPEQNPTAAVDLDELAEKQEFEYYWQDYPENASFWTRLDWSFDIVSSFRLTGWNWAIPCLPPYEPPPSHGDYQLPLEYTLPHRSKQGYTRTLSLRKLVFQRLFVNIVPAYLVVDLCAVLMTQDPYFVLGPDESAAFPGSGSGESHYYPPLPPHLAALSPPVLHLQRTLLGFLGVYSALQLVFNAGALALALLCRPFLGFRAHPWHLPTMGGSFAAGVLDRGLAGFWGVWWHQTFRFGFAAPTRWLLRRGYLGRGPGTRAATTTTTTLVGALVAFAQSGLLHAAGSYTTVPPTRPWMPPLFFLLSGLGALLQTFLARSLVVLRRWVVSSPPPPPPRWLRRAGNLAFVVAWLVATSWALLDDFGRCGLFLFEPVPYSVARAAGLGDPRDRRVWRYDAEMAPRWFEGRTWWRWWESGVGI
ncbi:membrane bound O-acyl transferase family-domain-containing protein [Xylariomycetidae sp. FL2044]|nr:membrane bound O-acyl transferase family-domain-containing protein [Xylariomycetidae sp. FL2044]